MLAAPVQPIDSAERAKHGVRYTPEEKEGAYQAWRVAAGRSLRRAADLTGIALGTLSNWSRDDRWGVRAAREDAEDAAALNRAIRGLGVAAAVRAVGRIERLAENAGGRVPERVQLEANVWLAAVAGVSPAKPLPLPIEPEADPYAGGEARPIDPDAIRKRQRQLAEGY